MGNFRKVQLTLGYCAERDLFWMQFRYHPEFLELWKRYTHYPARWWDPLLSVWWFEEPLLWRELEWLGATVGFETTWKEQLPRGMVTEEG